VGCAALGECLVVTAVPKARSPAETNDPGRPTSATS
jgi:hypothetical protein